MNPTSLQGGPVPLLALIATCALLGGCALLPVPSSVTPDAAQASLASGIRHYENGEYELADGQLRRALELGLPSPSDAVQAHKHRAFILCTSGRSKACHEEFRKALTIDPAFQLGKAEAGHPMWGPVFVQAKRESAAAGRR